MDTVVGTIVILGIIVRVVLDLVSLFKRTATLDFVYGGLFAALALVAFVAEGPNVWAFACIGVAWAHSASWPRCGSFKPSQRDRVLPMERPNHAFESGRAKRRRAAQRGR